MRNNSRLARLEQLKQISTKSDRAFAVNESGCHYGLAAGWAAAGMRMFEVKQRANSFIFNNNKKIQDSKKKLGTALSCRSQLRRDITTRYMSSSIKN